MKGMTINALRRVMEIPQVRGLDPDAPETTAARREIIRRKVFLRRIYENWYLAIARLIPQGPGRVLELGSGGGFLKDTICEAITSEVFPVPGISLLADATALPFRKSALKAVVMVDVFHHEPDCERLLKSAARCVRPGGAIIMIEPWVTPFSRLIYGSLHHEPFEPLSETWRFPSKGPLSCANGALAWIVFERDFSIFHKKFPQWHMDIKSPFMPFAYVLSGGVSMRSMLPGIAFPLVQSVERLLSPVMDKLAMFALIRLIRKETP